MSELGGLYKKMPWTFFLTLIGGLSISAFPLFSGFVSKSMIVQAGFDSHLLWAAFLLNLAAIGTFYCNGLKVPYFVWFGKNKCQPATFERAKDPPWNMLAAMGIAAFLCVFLGCYTPAPLPPAPVSGGGGGVPSVHLVPRLRDPPDPALHRPRLLRAGQAEEDRAARRALNLDLDWFYRMGGRAFLWLARKPVQSADTGVGEVYRVGGLVPLMKSAGLVGRL